MKKIGIVVACVLLLCLLLMLLSACTTKSDFYGEWEAEGTFSVRKITINEDKTAELEYSRNSTTSSRTWTYDAKTKSLKLSGESGIRLDLSEDNATMYYETKGGVKAIFKKK